MNSILFTAVTSGCPSIFISVCLKSRDIILFFPYIQANVIPHSINRKEKISYRKSGTLRKKLNRFLFTILITMVSGCSFSEIYRTSAEYCFIPFRTIGRQIPVVEAMWNKEKAWFIIDSGAFFTLLNVSETDRFGFFVQKLPSHQKTEVNGLGGKLTRHETFACRLDLGSLEIRHFTWKSGNINLFLNQNPDS